MKIRNQREYALDIPYVGVVNPGETIEVDDVLGASLCEQPANWAPVKSKTSKEES